MFWLHGSQMLNETVSMSGQASNINFVASIYRMLGQASNMCPIPSNSLDVMNFRNISDFSVILCEFCFPDILLRSVKLWLSVIFFLGVVAFFLA